MYQQVVVIMPPGVMPGQVMQIQTPAGIMQVQAPAGVPPGGQFVVNVPRTVQPAVQQYRQVERAPPQVRQTIQQQQYRPPPRSVPQPAPQQHRPAPQPYRPPAPQQMSRGGPLANGNPIQPSFAPLACVEGCWKSKCGCYCPCCLCCLTDKVVAVRQSTVAIVESFNKFVRVEEPGERLLYAPVGWLLEFEKIARTISTRVQEHDVSSTTKTLDNVFVTVEVTILFRLAGIDRAYDAAYKSSDIGAVLGDFVESAIRTVVSTVKLDDVFTMNKQLSDAVQAEASQRMLEYGYAIVDTLVTGIEPEHKVKTSMNEIEFQRRQKLAQVNAAEAQKAIQIKRAEANAEAKHLDGVGLARMRGAMIDGFATCISTVNVADDDKFSADATSLLLTTQYMDMLTDLGRDGVGGGTKLFLPTDMSGVDEMRNRLTMFQGMSGPPAKPRSATTSGFFSSLTSTTADTANPMNA